MMGQACQETGVFPLTKGADFSGPLAVLALTCPLKDDQLHAGFFSGSLSG